ncbi:hypothetical protein [Microbacterium sp. NPDC091662]|uniref:hypothetical protein n=1 Tax=Microbacterium sp. NPDC091662 TaxID=3364211 RepID=UPI003823F1F4
MKGSPEAARLRLLGDRAAWLRKESAELRTRVLVEKTFADEYWAHVEGTAAWARFLTARRVKDAQRALLGKRRKR